MPDELLVQIVDLTKLGQASVNCSPARIVFVKSSEAKERLKPLLSSGNRDKTMKAPATAIIGYDLEFYEKLPKLFPHTDARSWFTGKPEHITETAFRNGSLQGAYLIMAARALGLDCGPMSGFDQARRHKRVFHRRAGQSQLSLQYRIWRCLWSEAARAAIGVPRVGEDHLTA